MTPRDGVAGVVPAAGTATRLGSPAASKELIRAYVDELRADESRPDGTRSDETRPEEPLPVCYRLLHAFHEARIPTAYVVSRSSKSDLRQTLGPGDRRTPRLHHISLAESPSPAFSVAAATRLAGETTIALGFPDVLWVAEAAFERLLARLDDGADVALGLFPPAPDYPTVAVTVDAQSRVRGFRPRDQTPTPKDPAWTLAVWRPVFSRLLEQEVEDRYGAEAVAAPERRHRGGPDGELGLTEILERAVDSGMRVVGEQISEHPFLDIGEPERLAKALRRARGR